MRKKTMSNDGIMAKTISNLIETHLDKKNGGVTLDWFARCYAAYLVCRELGLIDASGRNPLAPTGKVAAAAKLLIRRGRKATVA
jgi:hypothetical protein